MKYNLKTSILLTALVIGVASCSTEKSISNTSETSDTTEANPNLYSITNTQFSAAKMELGKMENHDFHQSVKANGIFHVPPENLSSVSAYFGGYVKEISLLPGQKIKKGQVLFVLENPDYIRIQQNYLEAKGQLNYLKSDYERQKNLYKDKITSQKNFLKAETDYTITLVKYEALRKELGLMNINPDKLSATNIRTTIRVYSPLSGYITNVNISKGMFLRPEDIAVTITNTEHLHIELNVFEKYLSVIKIDQPIKFRIQNNNNQEYDASVYLINQSIDMETRTVTVHGHLEDESSPTPFIPGMYVEAEIFTSTVSKLSLPQNAIVEMEEKQYVLFVKSTDKESITLIKKLVEIGQTTNGFTEVKNYRDFQKGVDFLIKGAFNMITE